MRKHLYPEYALGAATATGEAAQQRDGRRLRRRDAGDHIGYSAWAS